MIDIMFIAKICGALMGVLVFVLYASKLHRDLLIAPWIRSELSPINAKVDVIARLMREKYREEYEQAENDILRENKMRGIV